MHQGDLEEPYYCSSVAQPLSEVFLSPVSCSLCVYSGWRFVLRALLSAFLAAVVQLHELKCKIHIYYSKSLKILHIKVSDKIAFANSAANTG